MCAYMIPYKKPRRRCARPVPYCVVLTTPHSHTAQHPLYTRKYRFSSDFSVFSLLCLLARSLTCQPRSNPHCARLPPRSSPLCSRVYPFIQRARESEMAAGPVRAAFSFTAPQQATTLICTPAHQRIIAVARVGARGASCLSLSWASRPARPQEHVAAPLKRRSIDRVPNLAPP